MAYGILFLSCYIDWRSISGNLLILTFLQEYLRSLKEQLNAEGKGERGALDQSNGSHVISMEEG